MAIKNGERSYTLQDIWAGTIHEGDSVPAYGDCGTLKRALFDVLRHPRTHAEVKSILKSLRTPTGRWLMGKSISESQVQLVVKALPSDRQQQVKVFVPQRETVQVDLRKKTVSANQDMSPDLYTRARVAQLTSFTVSQLIQLDREGLVVPKRYGGRIGYTWRQVIGLRFIHAINSVKDIRALRVAIAEGPLKLIEDESRDFSGAYLAAYGTHSEWVRDDSISAWAVRVAEKFGQGLPLNLISYDAIVSRLTKLRDLMDVA